jgi:hypothetical protein
VLRQIAKLLMAAGIVASVAACGGGSDSSGPTIDLSQLQANPAGTKTYSVSGWIGTPSTPVSGTTTTVDSGEMPATLNGTAVTARSLASTTTRSVDGVATTDSSNCTNFSDSTTKSLIETQCTAADGSASTVYDHEVTAPHPSVVTAGSRGDTASLTEYSDAAMTVPLRHSQSTFAVFADSDSSLLVVYTTLGYDNQNQLDDPATVTERVTTAGMRSTIKTESISYGPDGTTPSSDVINTAR